MQDIIQINTDRQKGLYDITHQVKRIVSGSNLEQGMVSVYVQGATAAIMIEFHLIDPLFPYQFLKPWIADSAGISENLTGNPGIQKVSYCMR